MPDKPEKGTHKFPVMIQVAHYFFVNCPKCTRIVDCDMDNQEVTCPDCQKTFQVDFNLFNCGL